MSGVNIDWNRVAQEFGTPLYLYDFDHFREQFLKLKNAFKARKSIIAYAVKANSNLSVVKHFAQLGSGADCVSILEIKRALLAGVDKYKIIFSGVGKRDDEIEEALRLDILMINVESEGELQRVEEIAKKRGRPARISVRVNPNIDPKTHPYISTGLSKNKFGVDIETAKKLYLYAHKSPHLEPVGIHFHIGSQLTQLEPIREASQIVADLVRSLKSVNIDIRFFDVGGGLGIVYKDETPIDPYDYGQAILSTLSGLDLTIICEPGRFLVGNGGYFLTRVLYEKRNGEKRFVIVDGAMNDLIRPSLYQAYHKVELIGGEDGEPEPADIVGPVCESGDFLRKDVPLPPTKPGDLIVVHSAGAYGFTMASNYNSRPRVPEIALENGKIRLIRRRERFEDLIAPEIDYLI
ncbi:MAG: diaminopimelate decarboxylase [Epsilonproteobacteria bacterium]|nr:diaminopimelate decarboxylase [Campylobacterota bacterium]NPA89544.1 diaminopimelate decarboxylase [Campylobacterota bacterium]